MDPKPSHEGSLANERHTIQFLLRGGLILSVVLMLVGLLTHLISGDTAVRSVSMLNLIGADLTTGDRLLGLGVLALAMTPVIRVFALALLWAQEKDWKFVTVAVIVLITLVISISLGGA